ncbi:MAG: hypothetical protein R2774_09115 [Saprospiraceae bacterium]
MNRSLVILFISCFLFSGKANAQNSLTPEQAKVVNLYVDYVNENIHGLWIIQRLFDMNNREINKYVGLPNAQINSYSNMDVIENIFIDRDHFYYKISPDSIYKTILKNKNILNPTLDQSLQAIALNMHNITFKLNEMRFDVEKLIKSLDLEKREHISIVYDKLEEAVSLFYDFYNEQKELEKILNNLRGSRNSKYTEFFLVYNTLYLDVIEVLKDLYSKDDGSFSEKYSKFLNSKKAFNSFTLNSVNDPKLLNPVMQSAITNTKSDINFIQKTLEDFINAESLPEKYKLLDKYYYYYNFVLLEKLNRYADGSGLAKELNIISSVLDKNLIKYLEMPHYLKIVYPKILTENTSLASSDPLIEKIPTSIKGRNVVIADRTIQVDSNVVEFKMYDHKIIDKDIVSISFNGDWIIEKYEISATPYTFNVQLNSNGKNFLLLHADDMGRNPPATIALSYMLNGKKEIIILNSDTQKSELIEIVSHQ